MPGTEWEDYPEGLGAGSVSGETRQDTAGSFKEQQEKFSVAGPRSGEVGGRQGRGMKGLRIQAGLLGSLLRAMGATDECQQGVCQEGDRALEEALEVERRPAAGGSLTGCYNYPGNQLILNAGTQETQKWQTLGISSTGLHPSGRGGPRPGLSSQWGP